MLRKLEGLLRPAAVGMDDISDGLLPALPLFMVLQHCRVF
jgi:hypothetical protein